ncbi:PREDICTED: uncharacterized protein At5g39570 [Ipomoea nil]|uniref:uncharacterized protein At5g39570 n=1 Tax=Ipomoea nil TaxID=35883 RepID=UPI0009016111|nr:PREDICTED: uncharacterized protein At5g39570 [Ipomoea nil]
MAFYGYQDSVGEYSTTPYHHFYATHQPSYEFCNPNLVNNCPNFHDYSGYYAKHPEVNYNYNYSVYSSSEPKVIQYDDGGYGFSETKFIVSYSTLEPQDDTDFDEYDPDPYDGGYDIAETYGKPLPPSSKTCYPRSTTNTLLPEPFSHGSIPSNSPHGKDPKGIHDQPVVKPSKETEPEIAKERDIVPTDSGKFEDLNKGNENSSKNDENGYGYGYDYQVGSIPYGYGLESVDICDSIFGYWPCWEKYQKGNCEVRDEESSRNPWESTAEYLFGSPFGYGGDERFGGFSYGGYYLQPNQNLNDG